VSKWNPDWEILALDVASTVGWCRGPLRGRLAYGSHRLAPEGASDGAVGLGMIQWLGDQLRAFKPRLIVFEAPIAAGVMQGKTNARTLRRLAGLPFVVESVGEGFGVYDRREVAVADVRHYWLGKRNMPGAQAKRLVSEKMRALGYEPKDYDASDAIAVHRFMAAVIDPTLRVEPLKMLRGTL
jgi:hypothetical protein